MEKLCLYDYVFLVTLTQKGTNAGSWGTIQLEPSWPPSETWVQVLRKPGKQSAEDAKRDARQWAAMSDEINPETEAVTPELTTGSDDPEAVRLSDKVCSTSRLIDVLRTAAGSSQITSGSQEIESLVEELCQFQGAVLNSVDELLAALVPELETRTLALPEHALPATDLPGQVLVKSITSQQGRASKEREQRIQGMQSQPLGGTTEYRAAVHSALNGFGEADVDVGAAEATMDSQVSGPSASIRYGPSTSFLAAGRQLAEIFTLNHKQDIAFRLICRQLDRIRREGLDCPQLCQFIGGEGGTGKSRIIAAVVRLFESKEMSHRLLVTATSGTTAANIDGITIHSACSLTKDTSYRRSYNDVDGARFSQPSKLFKDGQVRMHWQDKCMLIIDEVSMLGAQTLYAVNEQLCTIRESRRDFGGIPLVLFCGDFHQFRPVQERSILLPSVAIPWDKDNSFRVTQRYQHDKAHALWKKFTSVVMLDEQVRAAEDRQLRRLLSRIRQGIQDQTDLDLINGRCYREGRRIPWESGITVVTPLNKNRWNLNAEATLVFQRQRGHVLRIFLSEHKWKGGQPTEEEARMLLAQGDDSSIPVPAVFMFFPGMPVVVNRKTYQGLKLVNGASYEALDVVLDQAHPGHRINPWTILHFGPPAGILLASQSTKDFHFVGMPPGTILLTPMSTRIDAQKKRPWQQSDVVRRGLPCAPAFACTDYKVQGRTLEHVALELRGTRTSMIDGHNIPSQCDPYSLYVQLSRCRSLDGIQLLSRARERDVLGNKIPGDMVAAEAMLEQLSRTTVMEAESWGWPHA